MTLYSHPSETCHNILLLLEQDTLRLAARKFRSKHANAQCLWYVRRSLGMGMHSLRNDTQP